MKKVIIALIIGLVLVCFSIGIYVGAVTATTPPSDAEKTITQCRMWAGTEWKTIGFWCKPVLDKYVCEPYIDNYIGTKCQIVEECK